MCDFAPGDEVQCINGDWSGSTEGGEPPMSCPSEGGVYTITELEIGPVSSALFIGLDAFDADYLWNAAHFRKVQRRDLSVWLATENTIEEPKRVPVEEPA